jgi:hypothetical protein
MRYQASARVRVGINLFILSVAFLTWSYQIGRATTFQINGDYFEFWLSGRALAMGKDLYNPTQWGPLHDLFGNQVNRNPAFAFPPVMALLALPFGVLPLALSAVLWMFLSQWMTVASIKLAMHTWPVDHVNKYLLPVLAGTFLYRPVLVNIINGQQSGLFLLLLAAAITLMSRKSWFLSGFIVSLLLIRPNIGLLIVGLIGIWLLIERHWPAIYGLIGGVVAIIVLSFLTEPGWVSGWLSIGGEKLARTFGYHPNLWGFASLFCGRQLACILSLGGMFAAGLIGVTAWIYLKHLPNVDPGTVISVAISLGLLLAPYLWAYDQILLLIPLTVFSGKLIHRNTPYLLTATLHLWFSLLAAILLIIALRIGDDTPGAVLSLLALAMSLFGTVNSYGSP